MARLEEGNKAPDFELTDGEGKAWKLGDLRGQKVILYFYPADDTPGCTAQACDFRDNLGSLSSAGYQVLGVSPQDATSHNSFTSKYDLNFPLLVDEGHKVAESYGAWGEQTNYGNTYEGIIRSTFVIDEEGQIEQAKYAVKAKGHVERLKESLSL